MISCAVCDLMQTCRACAFMYTSVIDLIMKHTAHTAHTDISQQSSPTKDDKPCESTLFSRIKRRKAVTGSVSVAGQYQSYIDKANDCSPSVNAFEFWSENKDRFPNLVELAMNTLQIPATSAPAERVFSAGGLIKTPHRAGMHADRLSKMIMLKCNKRFLKMNNEIK